MAICDNRGYAGGHQLFTFLEDAEETPSFSDGISAGTERAERMHGAIRAKAIVSLVLSCAIGEDGKPYKCTSTEIADAEALACYALQLSFMYRSLREMSTDTVAAAASFLAIKSLELENPVGDVVEACCLHRIYEGEADLSEEEFEAFRIKVVKLESWMWRLVDFDSELVASNVGDILDTVLTAVSVHREFLLQHGASDLEDSIFGMRSRVMAMVVGLLQYTLLGYGTLIANATETAASAILIAVHWLRRELPLARLVRIVAWAMDEKHLCECRLKACIKEIVKTSSMRKVCKEKLLYGAGRASGAITSWPPPFQSSFVKAMTPELIFGEEEEVPAFESCGEEESGSGSAAANSCVQTETPLTAEHGPVDGEVASTCAETPLTHGTVKGEVARRVATPQQALTPPPAPKARPTRRVRTCLPTAEEPVPKRRRAAFLAATERLKRWR